MTDNLLFGRLQNVWQHPTLDATSKAPTGTATFTYGYTYTQPTPADLRVGATSGSNLKQDFMPYTVTRNSTTPSQVLTANRTYEATRNTLRSIENKAGTSVISRYTYGVNPITQRVSVTTAGSAFGATQANWNWQYDSLGQVIRADQTTNTASNRKYAYDNIGNRTKSASGTTALPTANNWTSNALNQYTVARGITLPTSPAPAPYDLDGNMTTGLMPGTNGNVAGVQTPANATEIKWDAENRLISFKIGTVTYNYQYDFLSRLITRLTGSTVNARYHYDGWNRITEYTNADLQDTFTWGLDLSGSMQGAGGVGGLLATRWITVSNTDLYPTYDGNGNISEYLNASGGIMSHYEYDPFGTLTRLTGSTSIRLQYRFSTKPRDTISGLYYYGYRWYDPLTGRWPSRDPIEEQGGLNLYGFVGNDGSAYFDILGLLPPDPDKPSVIETEAAINKLKVLQSIYASGTQPERAVARGLQKIIADLELHYRYQDKIATFNKIQRAPHPFGTGPTRIGVAGLVNWAIYSENFDTEIDKTNEANCNRFVATSISRADYVTLYQPASSTPFKELGLSRIASANYWYLVPENGEKWRKYAEIEVNSTAKDGAKSVVRLSKREPIMGDIVAFSNHVGIMLGHGLYLSSTARNDWREQNPHGVQIKPIPNISRVYIEVVNHQGHNTVR